MRELKSQRQVFRTEIKNLTATIDVSKVTTTRDGVKFLPAGTPLCSTAETPAAGDVLLDRSLKMQPKNDGAATGILKHDVYFKDGVDKECTFVYAGEAVIEEINAACQEVFTADIAAEAKTALKEISFVSAGHRQS